MPTVMHASYDELMVADKISGRLKRSSSLGKLRASIRRGSAKLVQKLKGHDWVPDDELAARLKRASSMSTLASEVQAKTNLVIMRPRTASSDQLRTTKGGS